VSMHKRANTCIMLSKYTSTGIAFYSDNDIDIVIYLSIQYPALSEI
jgi:hypothetical protein